MEFHFRRNWYDDWKRPMSFMVIDLEEAIDKGHFKTDRLNNWESAIVDFLGDTTGKSREAV